VSYKQIKFLFVLAQLGKVAYVNKYEAKYSLQIIPSASFYIVRYINCKYLLLNWKSETLFFSQCWDCS